MSDNPLKDIADSIGELKDKSHFDHEYYHFEPWDVQERDEWVYQRAIKDGVDLRSPDMLSHVGDAPRRFQSGIVLSTAFCVTAVAGSQTGKSYPALILMGCMVTGDVPISLRLEKGEVSEILRHTTPENVTRFGRRDAITGEYIDDDIEAPIDPQSWNCGFIEGAGLFPKEMILKPAGQIWLCTLQKALLNFWWPRFEENKRRVWPKHFIDFSKNNGFNKHDRIVNCIRDCKIVCLSYESGFDRVEAEMADVLFEDEEPPNEDIHQSALQHCKYMRRTFTPYRGITWSLDTIFPKEKSPDYETYHATQYDSPYRPNNEIERNRLQMKPWHVGARIWGFPTEVVGEPYYNYEKLRLWMQRYGNKKYLTAKFIPNDEYHGMLGLDVHEMHVPGLVDTEVRYSAATEENQQNVWRIYEDVMPMTPYLLTADPAGGAETPEEAADVCAAMILRPNTEEPNRPTIVATLRSTLTTIHFARVCSLAMRYYNNATVGAETKRSEYNATFLSEVREWPYWYYITTMNDQTQREKRHKGFDPNAKTRGMMYELVGEWIDAYAEDEYPWIPDLPLLMELSECVRGKGGRPDHKSNGTLDTTTAFAIALYIFRHSPEQVQYNGVQPDYDERRREIREKRHGQSPSPKAVCGLGHLGYRGVMKK